MIKAKNMSDSVKQTISNIISQIPNQFVWGVFVTILITTTLAVIGTGYNIIFSYNYWYNWLNFITSAKPLFIDFTHFIVTLGIIILPYISIKTFRKYKKENWIKRVSYNFTDHMNDLIKHLLDQYQNITNSQDFKNFITDTVDQLYMVFKQENSKPIITWMIPEHNTLKLKFFNRQQKLDINEYHQFRSGEGVAGKSWEEGKIMYFSPKQKNEFFKSRSGCDNSAYMCCPIGNKPKTKYGLIGIGFENGDKTIFSDYEISGLKLLATTLEVILENIDAEYKVW